MPRFRLSIRDRRRHGARRGAYVAMAFLLAVSFSACDLESKPGKAKANLESEGQANDQSTVPNLAGDSLLKAKAEVKRSDLTIGNVSRKTSSKKPGTVLNQSPNPGNTVKQDSKVTVVVAKPKPKPPPDSSQASNCTPGYSPCLPPASDYDCASGEGDGPEYATETITVTGSDPYELDSDGNGLGCEP